MALRTHTCGELNTDHSGQSVKLAGWVSRNRDLGGLYFFDLRDRYGKTQIVFDESENLSQQARNLNAEDVVLIEGKVRNRPDGMINKQMTTGEIEITAEKVTVLSKSTKLPLSVEDDQEPHEELKLRYRCLDLRRPRMIRNLAIRHKALQSIRRFHDEKGFTEVNTPFLIRSTPEGARDFIVPSRIHQGSFYSLPQSPQLYKQVLMVGGIDKYFQLAACFRDEDLRKDRQPEFTQIDVEMSFVDEGDIYELGEAMMNNLVKDTLGKEIETPFPKVNYFDAINNYGSDAPDIRYDLRIRRADEHFQGSGFKAFEGVLDNNGGVFGILAEGKGNLSRKEREKLEEVARDNGLAGLLTVPFSDDGLKGIIGKLFSSEKQTELCNFMNAGSGDLLMFAAGQVNETLIGLGRLRKQLAQIWNIIPENELRFCWVVNPPLFEPDEETNGLTPVHHAFTAPFADDIDKLTTDPLKVLCRAYDLVLNGVEMGSGSIRIHDPEIQAKVFEAMNINRKEAKKRFGFLLEVLSFGAPPHGGIALGFDRLVMMLAGESSIRDIIAFPKTTVATSLMDGAPSSVDIKQLDELGLKIIGNKQENE